MWAGVQSAEVVFGCSLLLRSDSDSSKQPRRNRRILSGPQVVAGCVVMGRTFHKGGDGAD